MTVHKLGVMKRQTGSIETVHKRSVEDCLEMIANADDVPDGELLTLDELEPVDFESGITIVGVNRCVDEPTVVVRELTASDLEYPQDDEPRITISMDSLTVKYSLDKRSESPDVIRAIRTN